MTQNNRSWARHRRVTAIALLAVSLHGCGGSLFDSSLPAPTRYVIAPPPPATTTTTVLPVDVAIGRPDVAPGLDTEQVAVLRGHELNYYRGALWGGSVTETVQTFMVAAFQDQKRFRSVTAEQARIAGDYLLDIEVRDFQAEYATAESAPAAHVTFVCRVIGIHDRRLLDTIAASATQPASENRMTAVAAAFETATRQVALDLTNRTAELIASDQQRIANGASAR